MVDSHSAPSAKRIQSKNCFVCGRENHRGLNVPFFYDGNSVSASYIPDRNLCGFDGVVHGGIIFALADEAMMHLLWASGLRAVTAEVTIRFHGSIKAGEPIEINASFDNTTSRIIRATCRVRTSDGTKIATAQGKFLPLKENEKLIFRKTF